MGRHTLGQRSQVGKDAIIDGGDAWYTGMTILASVLGPGILCSGTGAGADGQCVWSIEMGYGESFVIRSG